MSNRKPVAKQQSLLSLNKKQLQLNEEQLEELAEAFELFDRDGDQMIAAKELHVVLLAIGR